MDFWTHYIAGIEDVWLVLLISVFAVINLTARLILAFRGCRLRTLHRDQTGATYMLPLVLTIPVYLLLITMIIECTLMLTAKVGSVGAAYSAARAAAVWLPYENAMAETAPDYTPLENRKTMVRLAAARAMFPYASGSTSHASNMALDEFVAATANQQIAVFRAYSGNQKFDDEYLKRKFAYAFNSSKVEIKYLDPVSGGEYGDNAVPDFNAKIRLTLRYEAPIHTFGIARLFGERSQSGNHFVRTVISTVMIENEGVKQTGILNDKQHKLNSGKSLGIKYYDRASFDDSHLSNNNLIGQNPLSNSSGSVSTQRSEGENSIYSTAAERQAAQRALAALEAQLNSARAEDRVPLQEMIEDYRVALGDTPPRPFSQDASWYGSIAKPQDEKRPTRYTTYALETRWAFEFVGGSFGRTFVIDPQTGRVRLYRHISGGGQLGPSKPVIGRPRIGLGVAYAEIEGSNGSFELESNEVSIGGDFALGIGGVSQSNLTGDLSGGHQFGAMIGGGIGVGNTRYTFIDEYPSLEAAGFDSLWTNRDSSIVWQNFYKLIEKLTSPK